MATLNLSTATTLDNTIPEHWEAKVREDAALKAFWDKFEGKEGANKPIIVRNDFTKKAGDLVHINVLAQLGSDGVTGESTLEGNEEQLSLGQFDLSVDYVRNAVAFTKKAIKQGKFAAMMAANNLLSSWLARIKDYDMFTQLITTASPTEMWAGNATTDTTLGTDDTFGTTEIDKAKLALERKGAIPISVVGQGAGERGIFGMVISEVDAYNLRGDAVWNNAQKDAMPRGKDNPIFSGALGMYNGVVIYVHHGIVGYQGSPLRPECSVYGSHNNSVTTITVGANTNKNYTKMFPSTGTIKVRISGGSEEFISYTGKTNNTFTGCTRGASYGGSVADGAQTLADGDLIVLYNHRATQVAFGAEIAARSWGEYPIPIHQEHDYGFEKGVGIEAIYGQKAIEDSAGDKPNYLIMRSYAKNPSIGK